MQKAVVIGGGTGTSVVLTGLKQHNLQLTAVISVADSGGSTGRLRDEFGFQPVGDLRQSLAALASNDSDARIKQLLLYRFNQGSFKGHNLGNLMLTALQDMTGSTAGALEVATNIFQLNGEILPVTEKNVQLVVEYMNGEFQIGEHILDDYSSDVPKKIRRVLLSPRAALYPRAAQAIVDADLIVIGPGDYYASLQAALAVSGLKKPFAATKAQVVYISNLMTRFPQTHGMTARDHVAGIEKRLGRPVSKILLNSQPIKKNIASRYAADKEFPVVDDLEDDVRVIRAPIASEVAYQASPADTVPRSLLRHDQAALAKILVELLS